MPDKARRLDSMRVKIIEVNLEAAHTPIARAREVGQGAGVITINLEVGVGDKILIPEQGETWWVHRQYGFWTLGAKQDEALARSGGSPSSTNTNERWLTHYGTSDPIAIGDYGTALEMPVSGTVLGYQFETAGQPDDDLQVAIEMGIVADIGPNLPNVVPSGETNSPVYLPDPGLKNFTKATTVRVQYLTAPTGAWQPLKLTLLIDANSDDFLHGAVQA